MTDASEQNTIGSLGGPVIMTKAKVIKCNRRILINERQRFQSESNIHRVSEKNTRHSVEDYNVWNRFDKNKKTDWFKIFVSDTIQLVRAVFMNVSKYSSRKNEFRIL